jgi:hypothetical protein
MSVEFNDGNSEYLSYADAIVPAVPLTIACWFRTDDATVNQALASIAYGSSNTNYFLLWAIRSGAGSHPSEIWATTYGQGVSGTAYSGNTFSANMWHHAAAVFGGSSSRVAYLDASAGSEDTTPVTPVSLNRTAIGCLYRSSIGSYMSGRIGEVGIWSAELTADELASLAAGYAPSLVRPDQLYAYIPLRRELSSSDKYPIYNYEPLGSPLSFSENGSPVTAAHPGIICPQGPQISSVSPIATPVIPVAMHHYRNMRLT